MQCVCVCCEGVGVKIFIKSRSNHFSRLKKNHFSSHTYSFGTYLNSLQVKMVRCSFPTGKLLKLYLNFLFYYCHQYFLQQVPKMWQYFLKINLILRKDILTQLLSLIQKTYFSNIYCIRSQRYKFIPLPRRGSQYIGDHYISWIAEYYS